MAQCEAETLGILERMVDEIQSPDICNDRRLVVQQQLTAFGNQPDSWRMLIYIMQHSTSQSTILFALSELETVINLKYDSLEPPAQAFIHDALKDHMTQLSATVPPFIRKKLVKLLVLAGKQKWPRDYDDHYNLIMQLLQTEESWLLGLNLLHSTLEEMVGPGTCISSQRRDVLHQLNDVHIPHVLFVLTAILERISTKWRLAATAPPSPTFEANSSAVEPYRRNRTFMPQSVEFISVILALFDVLENLFSWAAMNHIPHQLISALFKFIYNTNFAKEEEDVCYKSMSVVNELLYRKVVPMEHHNMLVLIYYETSSLLSDLISETNNTVDPDDEFFEKLAELLTLLIDHLWRLEDNQMFNVLDVLSKFFAFTEAMPTIHTYIRCLPVWNAFIKQVKPDNICRYVHLLDAILGIVMKNMQFTCNEARLGRLNFVNKNADGLTEWQQFQQMSIEIIALISELAPENTFELVLVPWKDVYGKLHSLEKANGQKLDTSDSANLLSIVKDLSTLTQTLARMVTPFNTQDSVYFNQAMPVILTLMENLITNGCLAYRNELSYSNNDNPLIIEGFVELHSEILSALKSWMGYYEVNMATKSKDLCILLKEIIPLIRSSHHSPEKVTLAAAHLLFGITTIISPVHFLLVPGSQELMHITHTLVYPNQNTRSIVLCAVATFLLKPWGDVSAPDAQVREMHINNYFQSISCEYLNIQQHFNNHAKCLQVVTSSLSCLTNIVEYSADFPSLSKKMLYAALVTCIEFTLASYNDLSVVPGVNEVQLQFIYIIMDKLKTHIGVDTVNRAVRLFLDLITREQQLHKWESLEILFKLLQLSIEGNDGTSKRNLPEILRLCGSEVYVAALNDSQEYPEVKIALVNLLHRLLLNHWGHFCMSAVRMGQSPNFGESDIGAENPETTHKFYMILQTFGECLLQPDINVFYASLNALEDLNLKRKLYYKPIFKQRLWSEFLTVLFRALYDKNLFEDEIVQAIYHMACVGFEEFFDNFIIQYLEANKYLTAEQRSEARANFGHAADMPTFVNNLLRFMNDVRCFTRGHSEWNKLL